MKKEENSEDEYIRELGKRMGILVRQKGKVIASKKDRARDRKGRRKGSWRQER